MFPNKAATAMSSQKSKGGSAGLGPSRARREDRALVRCWYMVTLVNDDHLVGSRFWERTNFKELLMMILQ